MELTIVEYDLVNLNPSEIAAASLCLAMKLNCDTPEWVGLMHSIVNWFELCTSHLLLAVVRARSHMGRSILVVFLVTILAISRLSINPTHVGGSTPPACQSLFIFAPAVAAA